MNGNQICSYSWYVLLMYQAWMFWNSKQHETEFVEFNFFFGQYKTWTLDSGLDHGLDSGLNNGLNIWTRILIARGLRSHQTLSSNVWMFLDVMSPSSVCCSSR